MIRGKVLLAILNQREQKADRDLGLLKASFYFKKPPYLARERRNYESWFWGKVIPELEKAGFRVIGQENGGDIRVFSDGNVEVKIYFALSCQHFYKKISFVDKNGLSHDIRWFRRYLENKGFQVNY